MLYRPAGSAAVITLNRPEVLNAINGPVHRGLLEGLNGRQTTTPSGRW